MFASRRDRVDDEVRDRFVRVVGLPELDEDTPLPRSGPWASAGVSGAGSRRGGADSAGSRGAADAAGSRGGVDSAGSRGVVDGPGSPGAGDTDGFRDVGGGVRSRGPAGAVWSPGDVTAAAPTGVGDGAGALRAFDPGRRGVRALAIVALLAVSVAAFFAWRARPRTEPVAPARVEAPASASGPTASPGIVVVAVSGRVQRPGLVRLPAGSRVADAIEAAGGALPDTDLSLVNLARKLVDGELVAVGIAAPPAAGGAAGPAGTDAGPLNLNSATAAQFEALPGIGPVLAQHMVDYRSKHGQFKSVEELRQVEGLGTSRFNQIKDLVTV